MKGYHNYQKQQIEAIHTYFNKVKKKTKDNPSMTDVVISWFTEGHAEKFRNEYLKRNSLYT